MKVTESSTAYKAFRPMLGQFTEQEAFVALALNSTNEIIGEPWLVGLGTANAVEVHPRDVFREAIRRNAIAVIIAHNHPSGEVDPSQMDRDLTARMKQAGKVVGLDILDHIVVGKDKYYSFADKGAM